MLALLQNVSVSDQEQQNFVGDENDGQLIMIPDDELLNVLNNEAAQIQPIILIGEELLSIETENTANENDTVGEEGVKKIRQGSVRDKNKN